MTNGDGVVCGTSSWASVPFWCWAAGPGWKVGTAPLGKSRVAKLELLRRLFRRCHLTSLNLPSLCTFVLFACVVNSMRTSVHDARVNSGRRMNQDACARTNSCSWAHAHGGGPWNEDSEAVFREPGWATCRQYCSTYSERGVLFTAAPKEVQVEAWEGCVLTCFRPKTWVETIAEECEVTMSAMTDFLKGPQVPGPGPFQRDSVGLNKETSHFPFWASVVPGCSAR